MARPPPPPCRRRAPPWPGPRGTPRRGRSRGSPPRAGRSSSPASPPTPTRRRRARSTARRRSMPTCAACRRSGSPRRGLPLQRGQVAGLPRRARAGGLGPPPAVLGDRVVDHRHGRHPRVVGGAAGPLLRHARGVDRHVGAGLALGVLVPGPRPVGAEGPARRPASPSTCRPTASVVRCTVDSDSVRPASRGRTSSAATAKLPTTPAMQTAWVAPGVRSPASSPRSWSPGQWPRWHVLQW